MVKKIINLRLVRVDLRRGPPLPSRLPSRPRRRLPGKNVPMESVADGKFPGRENEGRCINLLARLEILTTMSLMELGVSVLTPSARAGSGELKPTSCTDFYLMSSTGCLVA